MQQRKLYLISIIVWLCLLSTQNFASAFISNRTKDHPGKDKTISEVTHKGATYTLKIRKSGQLLLTRLKSEKTSEFVHKIEEKFVFSNIYKYKSQAVYLALGEQSLPTSTSSIKIFITNQHYKVIIDQQVMRTTPTAHITQIDFDLENRTTSEYTISMGTSPILHFSTFAIKNYLLVFAQTDKQFQLQIRDSKTGKPLKYHSASEIASTFDTNFPVYKNEKIKVSADESIKEKLRALSKDQTSIDVNYIDDENIYLSVGSIKYVQSGSGGFSGVPVTVSYSWENVHYTCFRLDLTTLDLTPAGQHCMTYSR